MLNVILGFEWNLQLNYMHLVRKIYKLYFVTKTDFDLKCSNGLNAYLTNILHRY